MQRFLEKHNHIGQDILEVFDFKQAPLFSYFFQFMDIRFSFTSRIGAALIILHCIGLVIHNENMKCGIKKYKMYLYTYTILNTCFIHDKHTVIQTYNINGSYTKL